MKTLAIIVIIAFLGVCVLMAMGKRDAQATPTVTKGLTYRISKDTYEAGVGRYEIGVKLNQEASEADVKAISEWIKSTRDKSDTFIIFFYIPEKGGAWGRVDYASTGSAQVPQYKFELMPKLEY